MKISDNHLKAITYMSRVALFSMVMCIAFFSLIKTFPFGLSHADKILHMVGYFTITILAILSWPHQRRHIAMATLCLGLIIEILQIFQPERAFHLSDVLANIMGIISAIFLAWCAKRFLIKPSVKSEG